jgi:hypothetical protein
MGMVFNMPNYSGADQAPMSCHINLQLLESFLAVTDVSLFPAIKVAHLTRLSQMKEMGFSNLGK